MAFKSGRNEGIRVLDEVMHDANPEAGLTSNTTSHSGENEGFRMVEETVSKPSAPPLGEEGKAVHLTEQQQQALDAQRMIPPRVIDPRTKTVYVLVSEADYEALWEILEKEG